MSCRTMEAVNLLLRCWIIIPRDQVQTHCHLTMPSFQDKRGSQHFDGLDHSPIMTLGYCNHSRLWFPISCHMRLFSPA
jgi:hypothetical protein